MLLTWGAEYKDLRYLLEFATVSIIDLAFSLISNKIESRAYLLSNKPSNNLNPLFTELAPNMAQSNIAELKDEKRCTNKDCTYNNNTSVLKCEGCGAPME